jgi:hypothetical protein
MIRLTERNKHTGKAILKDMPAYAEYDPIERLAYYEDKLEKGLFLELPEDGMVYYIEENKGGKWVGNRPIQDIVFKYGWGFVTLDFSLRDFGKKFFFSREKAEVELTKREVEEALNS